MNAEKFEVFVLPVLYSILKVQVVLYSVIFFIVPKMTQPNVQNFGENIDFLQK